MSKHSKRQAACYFLAAVILIGTLVLILLYNTHLRRSQTNLEHAEEEKVEDLYQYQSESNVQYDVRTEVLQKPVSLTAREQILYEQTVSTLLEECLWTERDMYDAAHYLMVPMHYAFASGDAEKTGAFHDFFARFYQDVSGKDRYGFRQQPPGVSLMQFCYFGCEYLRLCAITGALSQAPDGLYAYLYDQIEYLYTEVPGNWGTEKNYMTRAEQILLHKEYDYSYYGWLSDCDFFPLASLCDLRVVAKIAGYEDTLLMQKGALLAYRIYTDPEIVMETADGGYLLQVGVVKDYEDYAYAGNQEIYDGIQPKTRDDIAQDSSHSTRQALWLTSFQQAQDYQEQYELFQTRKQQLANQLMEYVIQYVDGIPLATTFMDGTCGVYRYSYNAEGTGIQGYDLSYTLLLGWWTFLKDQRITQVYKDILAQFPMNPEVNPYYDCTTTREQNPFFDVDTAFDNGMLECVVTLAYKLDSIHP